MTGIERVLDRLDMLDRIDENVSAIDARLRGVEVDVARLTERSDAAESLDNRVRVLEQSHAKGKGGQGKVSWKLIAALVAAASGGGAGLAKAADAIANVSSEDTDR